jgi:hypothetical protein
MALSAKAGARPKRPSLTNGGLGPSSESGIELVIHHLGERAFLDLLDRVRPESTACVAQAATPLAPAFISVLGRVHQRAGGVDHVASVISSGGPSTSPMMCMTSCLLARSRRLSRMIAACR